MRWRCDGQGDCEGKEDELGCGECGGEVGTVRGRRTSWGVVSVGCGECGGEVGTVRGQEDELGCGECGVW